METTTTNEETTIEGLAHEGVGESGPTKMVPAFPVAKLKPAPWNPRKHVDQEQLAALAADITTRGIIEPLVVREFAEHHEIVCGFRRYLAARRVGLDAVPVIVRELDDRAALEVAISENGQREGLHPLEEADGFAVLHTKHGMSVDDIATRFGVSTKLVYQRLSLAKLTDEGRKAFLEGKINWGVALRIARVENLDWQKEALGFALSQPGFGTDVCAVSRWIANRYAVRLASAPFDVGDAKLVASAGACTTCPKNSDAQRALFGEEVAAGECLDVVCFASKKEAAWKLVAAQYSAQGITVLSAEQSTTIMPPWRCAPLGGGYVRADEKPYDHAQGRKTWRELLGVHAPPVVVARGADGNAVEVFEPSAFKAAKTAAGLNTKKLEGKGKSKSSASSSKGVSEDSWKTAQELEAKIATALATACQDALSKRALSDSDRGLWQLITLAIAVIMDPEISNAVFAKRNKGKSPTPQGGDAYAFHRKEVAALSPSGCRSLLFELLFAVASDTSLEIGNDLWSNICAFFKVDDVAITKKIREEAEAAKKKPAAPAPTPKKGAAKAGAKPSKPAPKSSSKKPAAKKGGAKQ